MPLCLITFSTSYLDAENSTKLIQAIAWRSTSSRSSSCKSLVASSSKSASTWTEFNNDLFDDYGGMESGSHSLTLGRLYAWEKKLYEEVKVNHCYREGVNCSMKLSYHDFILVPLWVILVVTSRANQTSR